MTPIASSSPSDSTRRATIQSGIECRSPAVAAPPCLQLGQAPAGVGGDAAHHRVHQPGARGRARLGAAQRPRLAHGLVDGRVVGDRVREGDLVGAEPQDVADGGLEGVGPVEGAVDEPVERAAALHGAVDQAGGAGAGARVELGAARLGGEGAVGVGALVHPAQHAQGDGALAA